MAIDLTLLKAELTADPKTLGYPADASDTAKDSELLNTIGASGETIEPEFVPAMEMQEQVGPADYTALTDTKRTLWSVLVAASASSGGFPLKSTGIRLQLVEIWGGTTTGTRIIVLQSRSATRAEVLFGEGIFVSPQDCAAARIL